MDARVLKEGGTRNRCNLGLDQLHDAPVCPSFLLYIGDLAIGLEGEVCLSRSQMRMELTVT